jgi:type IV secretion system protein VirB2
MARRAPANRHFRREGIKLSNLTQPTDAEFVIAREPSKEGGASGEEVKHVCPWHRELFYLPPANRALERIRKAAASICPTIVAAGVSGATAAQAQTVGGTDPSTILQAIATYILGPFGQALAVLALIGVGISFLVGRLGLFGIAAFIGGLILVFGSSYLVQQFLGGL